MIATATALGGLDSSTLILLLSLTGILSFALIFVTSFVKIIIVLGLLRSALGTPRIPPTSVLSGIAIILSFYIMYPVVSQVVQTAAPRFVQFQAAAPTVAATGNKAQVQRVEMLVALVKEGSEPVR
ncbi:hypothetical protein KKF84_18105, partial [Myxococcota bacterium]|nr:hypothetical protein [Myxococcota bacterium]MBU1537236.1 hypothetical protein [Myxococcota bacterium]